jgi:hypothetical protein
VDSVAPVSVFACKSEQMRLMVAAFLLLRLCMQPG